MIYQLHAVNGGIVPADDRVNLKLRLSIRPFDF